MPVVLSRFLVREECHGASAGAGGVVDRAPRVAGGGQRRARVVSELVEVRLEIAIANPFESFGYSTVKGRAARRGNRLVERLAEEGMREARAPKGLRLADDAGPRRFAGKPGQHAF